MRNIRCYNLESKIEKLDWFVGGNVDKIRELQRKLNDIGTYDRLMEDGVYGKKTYEIIKKLEDNLIAGSAPVLNWINPLKSNFTGVESTYKITKNGNKFSQLTSKKSNKPLFKADLHNYKNISEFSHINVASLDDANKLQTSIAKRLDHQGISEDAYNLLKNFDESAKIVKISGKTLIVAGVIFDLFELIAVVEQDLNDADKKLGKSTLSETIQILGSWAGGAAGAEIGSTIGAMVGTLVLPGLGTAIGGFTGGLILGVIGASLGDKLAEYTVDISYIGV